MTITRPTLIIGAIAAGLACCLVAFCAKEDVADDRQKIASDLLEKFRSVPYTAVTDERMSEEPVGVTVHVPSEACRGYNLYCLRTEGTAILMDMEGREVHRWSDESTSVKGWPYGVILENGDLIAYREDRGIVRLDWTGKALWRVRGGVHHEIYPLPDGSFYALVRRTVTHRGLNTRFSEITRFSGEGEVIEAWSAYEHLDDIKRALDTRSFLDTVLDSIGALGINLAEMDTLPPGVHRAKSPGWPLYDYFHMNTVSILPDTPAGRADARFRAGNLLTCFRNVNQIAVLDRDTMEIVWAWGEGDLEWPHHPTMLDDGSILIFDNGVVREYTRVIELDPITETITWEYVGDPPESFYSPTRGSVQRLPNGNTLICEGDRGRCFEISRAGEIVWEWINPATDNKGRRAQIYRMMRYQPEFIESLLEAGG